MEASPSTWLNANSLASPHAKIMPVHVHLHEAQLAQQIDQIRPLLDQDVTISTGSKIPMETELLITEDCPANQLDSLTALKWVLLPCAGVTAPMRPILNDRPHISAHNLHYNDISVAESALALLMATSKRIIPLDQKLRQGSWTPTGVDTSHAMLAGSRCLLLGYGAIGQRIAPILQALGIQVCVMKRTHSDDLPYPCLTADNWQESLPATDILLSALPSTTETDQIINQDVLDALPNHAIVINVGRGSNIDDEALFLSLKNGTIAAAGLDVWWNYPETFPYVTDDHAPPCFPSNYPYQELDNVVMMPHRGADHRMIHLKQRLITMLAERINQASRHQTLPSKISPARGY